MGRLGRKRAFLVTPKSTKITLPSDLDGLGRAYYDDARLRNNMEDVASATDTACRQLKKAINREWQSLLSKEKDRRKRLILQAQSQSIDKLQSLTFRIDGILSSTQHEVIRWWQKAWPPHPFDIYNPHYRYLHEESWGQLEYEQWVYYGAHALDAAAERATHIAIEEVKRIEDEFRSAAKESSVEDAFNRVIGSTIETLQHFPRCGISERWVKYCRHRMLEYNWKYCLEVYGERPWLLAADDFNSLLHSMRGAVTDWWDHFWPRVEHELRALQEALADAQVSLAMDILVEEI